MRVFFSQHEWARVFQRDSREVLQWLWDTRPGVRPRAPGRRARPTTEIVSGINMAPHNADEALSSLLAVSERFLSMEPRHPLGYFPDVYGREMTTRARIESLNAAGSHGYFKGSEDVNFAFIGKFAMLYLRELHAWLEGNEGSDPALRRRPEFAAWHLSFEYCQLNADLGRSIPLIEAATGFIPHIINDLGMAFALTNRDFRASARPVDLEALRKSHWNVANLLEEAAESTLKRYREDFDCPLAQQIHALGLDESLPRIVLWILMDWRIQAWFDFLSLDASGERALSSKKRQLDRSSDRYTRLLLGLLGDDAPNRWRLVLEVASMARVVMDSIEAHSDLGVRYGMPARRGSAPQKMPNAGVHESAAGTH